MHFTSQTQQFWDMTRDSRREFPKAAFAGLLSWAAGSLSQGQEGAQCLWLLQNCLHPIINSTRSLWKGHLEDSPLRFIPPQLQPNERTQEKQVSQGLITKINRERQPRSNLKTVANTLLCQRPGLAWGSNQLFTPWIPTYLSPALSSWDGPSDGFSYSPHLL